MSNRTCYHPDGKVASNHTACYSDSSKHSACCNKHHYCFDNGLCLDHAEMTTYRGGCTDNSWDSNECTKLCWEDGNGNKASGVSGVWVCNNDNVFACDWPLCDNVNEQFRIPGGKLIRTAAVDSAIGLNSSSDSDSNSTTSAQNGTAGTGGQPTCSNDSTTVAGVGAGLGIALLVALLTIGFLAWKLRKSERRPKNGGVDSAQSIALLGQDQKWFPSTPYSQTQYSQTQHSQTQYSQELPNTHPPPSELQAR